MTERPPDSIWSGIDIPKTIAGALAAVCAAVVGSFLGVAGTLVGAAVASIVGSVGTEIYHRSLNRGAKKLQTLTPAFIKVPAAVGTPEVAAATAEESPSHTVVPKRQIRWRRVAMVAGALFVLAMGSLTVAEAITGKSIASTVGNNTGAKSTWSGIVHPGKAKPTPTPSPSAPATTGPTHTATTAPSTAPSAAPSAVVTSAPEVVPTTAAPVTTQAPALNQNQDQPQQKTN
jgi:hypothetical protein